MPFTLQPAVKNDFINREDILKEMLSTLQDENVRMGYALVGPRRIGKTSILKEVIRGWNKKRKAKLFLSIFPSGTLLKILSLNFVLE
jgi:AAA+ ATPase superfamily predicted ATPase